MNLSRTIPTNGRKRYFADGKRISRDRYETLHALMIRNGSLSSCQTRQRCGKSGKTLVIHSCSGSVEQ